MRGVIVAGWFENFARPVNLLAVIGGAVVGGLLVGLFTQLLVRVLTTRKMPRWALNTVRLAGAVAAGWLVALWVFGGGGLGFGGPGGWGFGQGSGSGTSTTNGARPPDTRPPQEHPGDGPSAAAETVRVEVLGNAPLEKLSADTDHRYRVEDKDGRKLLTLAEVKDYIRERQKREPPLRHVALVVYKDSPAKDKPQVTDLAAWAADLMTADKQKMKVDFVVPDAEAPIR
jgi:hypothetical protein